MTKMMEDLMKSCKENTYTIDDISDVFGLQIPRPKYSPKKLNRELNRRRHILNKENSTKTIAGTKEHTLDREQRQLVIATLGVVAVTSLISYFTATEIINMASGSDTETTDNLVDNNNHIITTLEDEETKISRMENDVKQLKKM